MRILLIEDDSGITTALTHALQTTYTLDTVNSGADGLSRAELYNYNVIILDLNLPDMTGLEVCRSLRGRGVKTPVLVLTGEAKVMSKITLLDAGADDYLTKPFSLGELQARLRVLTRRDLHPKPSAAKLIADDIVLDTTTHQVSRSGQMIKLRRKEFAMLECLMQHAGSVVTRETLSKYVWGDSEEPWTNTIDVHIKYLRDKVDRPFERPLIKTVHGLGYKLDANRSVAKYNERR